METWRERRKLGYNKVKAELCKTKRTVLIVIRTATLAVGTKCTLCFEISWEEILFYVSEDERPSIVSFCLSFGFCFPLQKNWRNWSKR